MAGIVVGALHAVERARRLRMAKREREGVETRSWCPKETRAIETAAFSIVNGHDPTVFRAIEDVSRKNRKKVSKVSVSMTE